MSKQISIHISTDCRYCPFKVKMAPIKGDEDGSIVPKERIEPVYEELYDCYRTHLNHSHKDKNADEEVEYCRSQGSADKMMETQRNRKEESEASGSDLAQMLRLLRVMKALAES